MKKQWLIGLILIGMSLSSCTTTQKIPVTDVVVVRDIRASLVLENGYLDFKSVEITDRKVDGSTFTIKAKVMDYRYDALVTTFVNMTYTKNESKWERGTYSSTLISAVAFREPVLPDALDDFLRPYLSRLYKAYWVDSNYGMGFNEIYDTQKDFENNKVTYQIKGVINVGIRMGEEPGSLVATYHYPDGWTYEVIDETYTEEAAWAGKYLIEHGSWVKEVFIPTDSFELTISGAVKLEVDSNGNEQIINEALCTFTLDGIDYSKPLYIELFPNGKTNLAHVVLDYGEDQYDYFEIMQVEEWQNNDPVAVLKIWQGMKELRITRIE